MKKKFILYVAAPGTYDATITSLHLTPMELNEKTFNKDIRGIKKQLKLSNVVVEASEFILKKMKLDYIFVIPKIDRENIWFYRDNVQLSKYIRYVYPMLLVKLKSIKNQKEIKRIELVKEMLLGEYIEGIDDSVN